MPPFLFDPPRGLFIALRGLGRLGFGSKFLTAAFQVLVIVLVIVLFGVGNAEKRRDGHVVGSVTVHPAFKKVFQHLICVNITISFEGMRIIIRNVRCEIFQLLQRRIERTEKIVDLAVLGEEVALVAIAQFRFGTGLNDVAAVIAAEGVALAQGAQARLPADALRQFVAENGQPVSTGDGFFKCIRILREKRDDRIIQPGIAQQLPCGRSVHGKRIHLIAVCTDPPAGDAAVGAEGIAPLMHKGRELLKTPVQQEKGRRKDRAEDACHAFHRETKDVFLIELHIDIQRERGRQAVELRAGGMGKHAVQGVGRPFSCALRKVETLGGVTLPFFAR